MDNKDLIKQYVDTGIELPEYQATQLPSWAMKTYIRKRWIASENGRKHMPDFEVTFLNDEQKYIYLENRIVRGHRISDYAYSLINDKLKEIYQRQILNKPGRYMQISIKQYSELPNVKQKDDLKQELLRYLNLLIDTGWDIKPSEVELKKYLDNEQ